MRDAFNLCELERGPHEFSDEGLPSTGRGSVLTSPRMSSKSTMRRSPARVTLLTEPAVASEKNDRGPPARSSAVGPATSNSHETASRSAFAAIVRDANTTSEQSEPSPLENASGAVSVDGDSTVVVVVSACDDVDTAPPVTPEVVPAPSDGPPHAAPNRHKAVMAPIARSNRERPVTVALPTYSEFPKRATGACITSGDLVAPLDHANGRPRTGGRHDVRLVMQSAYLGLDAGPSWIILSVIGIVGAVLGLRFPEGTGATTRRPCGPSDSGNAGSGLMVWRQPLREHPFHWPGSANGWCPSSSPAAYGEPS